MPPQQTKKIICFVKQVKSLRIEFSRTRADYQMFTHLSVDNIKKFILSNGNKKIKHISAVGSERYSVLIINCYHLS